MAASVERPSTPVVDAGAGKGWAARPAGRRDPAQRDHRRELRARRATRSRRRSPPSSERAAAPSARRSGSSRTRASSCPPRTRARSCSASPTRRCRRSSSRSGSRSSATASPTRSTRMTDDDLGGARASRCGHGAGGRRGRPAARRRGRPAIPRGRDLGVGPAAHGADLGNDLAADPRVLLPLRARQGSRDDGRRAPGAARSAPVARRPADAEAARGAHRGTEPHLDVANGRKAATRRIVDHEELDRKDGSTSAARQGHDDRAPRPSRISAPASIRTAA